MLSFPVNRFENLQQPSSEELGLVERAKRDLAFPNVFHSKNFLPQRDIIWNEANELNL